MGDNDTIFCQRAEDELQVVISKTFRTSANGICQMPAGNVPIYAMKEVAEAVRGARSNMTPTMKQQLEINGSVSLISDICGCGGTHSRTLKDVFSFGIDVMRERQAMK